MVPDIYLCEYQKVRHQMTFIEGTHKNTSTQHMQHLQYGEGIDNLPIQIQHF